MVKVVAKRISLLDKFTFETARTIHFHEIGRSEDLLYPVVHREIPLMEKECLPTEAEAWAFLQKLVSEIPRGPVLHDWARPIAAVLVDADGRVLGAGVNSNSINKTLHAEVNLIQSYFLQTHQSLPAGATLYVTHKPCKMCAAMIYESSPAGQPIQVRYLHEELGCRSRFTILDTF
jgi:hypothetical protein